jgi:hypothetical protein
VATDLDADVNILGSINVAQLAWSSAASSSISSGAVYGEPVTCQNEDRCRCALMGRANRLELYLYMFKSCTVWLL